MTKTFTIILLCVALPFFARNGYAQDTTANQTADSLIKFPSVVLVQLRSEHNRIEALKKARKYREADIVQTDAGVIRTKMIADFRDHITFCPVYFYADTNAELVKQKKFDGILFNADSTPVKNLIINDSSRDYFIVYYGYPNYQSRARDTAFVTELRTENNVEDALGRGVIMNDMSRKEYPEETDEIYGKGLVINNYRFQQVSFLYKFGYDNVLFKMKRSNRKYVYVSKRFDMEYFPFAERLDLDLFHLQAQLRKKIRIKRYVGQDLRGLLW